jgi:hypothetical protein
MLTIIFLILLCLIISSVQSTINTDTRYNSFSLNETESFIEKYSVSNNHYLTDFVMPETPTNRASAFGYMILSTSTPGTYQLITTTKTRGDFIEIEWKETFSCNQTVGDKFDRHDETNRCQHVIYGGGGPQYSCISDDNSDCTITMTQGDGWSPELQIYIYGHGSGTISINRTG